MQPDESLEATLARVLDLSIGVKQSTTGRLPLHDYVERLAESAGTEGHEVARLDMHYASAGDRRSEQDHSRRGWSCSSVRLR